MALESERWELFLLSPCHRMPFCSVALLRVENNNYYYLAWIAGDELEGGDLMDRVVRWEREHEEDEEDEEKEDTENKRSC